MPTLQTINERLAGNVLIHSVDDVPRGHIRIETSFLYPDGSAIDVFLEQDNRLLPDIGGLTLTDFGSTWSWLQNLEIRPNKSATNRMHFDRILDLYGCRLNGSAIEQDVPDLDQLPAAIVQLGQACLRTADLIYSKRFRAQNNFNQDVETVISDLASDYQIGGEVPLRTGNIVKLDFRVRGRKHETAIITLSSGSEQAARNRAFDINARWDDLRDLSDWTQLGNQCVTVFDDDRNVYSMQDLNRLERKSILVPLSSPETLGSVLEAA
jgi:hypothetical protein